MRHTIVLLALALVACGEQREPGPIEGEYGELNEADATRFEQVDAAIGQFDRARGDVVGAAPTRRTAAELAAAVMDAEASYGKLENRELATAVGRSSPRCARRPPPRAPGRAPTLPRRLRALRADVGADQRRRRPLPRPHRSMTRGIPG